MIKEYNKNLKINEETLETLYKNDSSFFDEIVENGVDSFPSLTQLLSIRYHSEETSFYFRFLLFKNKFSLAFCFLCSYVIPIIFIATYSLKDRCEKSYNCNTKEANDLCDDCFSYCPPADNYNFRNWVTALSAIFLFFFLWISQIEEIRTAMKQNRILKYSNLFDRTVDLWESISDKSMVNLIFLKIF